MAKAKVYPIDPFPSHLDRDAFGHWLSGFTDGEGHFALQSTRTRQGFSCRNVRFEISLRADDWSILTLVQSFFRCGFVTQAKPCSTQRHPVGRIVICNLSDCHNVLLPHFAACPLRAKKRHDFTIWKEAVELAYRVSLRPFCNARVPSVRSRAGIAGFLPKWSADESARFSELAARLKAVRTFSGGHLFVCHKSSEVESVLLH